MDKNKFKEQIKSKRMFIFDMDGTILDLEELNHQSYLGTVKKFFWIDLGNDDYQKYFSGTRTAEAFDRFAKTEELLYLSCDFNSKGICRYYFETF